MRIFPLLCPLREPGSSRTLVPVTIPSVQNLVSKYYSPPKEARTP